MTTTICMTTTNSTTNAFTTTAPPAPSLDSSMPQSNSSASVKAAQVAQAVNNSQISLGMLTGISNGELHKLPPSIYVPQLRRERVTVPSTTQVTATPQTREEKIEAAMCACKKDSFALCTTPTKYGNDPEIVIAVTNVYPEAMRGASVALRNNKSFMSERLKVNPTFAWRLHPDLLKDPEIAAVILKNHPDSRALNLFSDEVLKKAKALTQEEKKLVLKNQTKAAPSLPGE